MSAKTSIEWCDRTWNPVRGCTVVSVGCKNCYAMKVAARFSGPGLAYEGLALRSPARWTGKVQLVEKDLLAPLSWRKPQRIFVNSMSDLFHESLPDEAIDRVFAVMGLCSREWTVCRRDHDHDEGTCRGREAALHTFQVLTKRPERMRSYLSLDGRWGRIVDAANALGWAFSDGLIDGIEWPPPNVWLGVSVEDQRAADERIPLLLQTPAAVRFLSVEPLLGPVVIPPHFSQPRPGGRIDTIDWVIVGGESGPGARPCDVAWIRSVVEQCRAAGVPCFVKQLGARPIDARHSDIVCGEKVHYVRPIADTMCHEASRTPGYSVRPHEMARVLSDPKGGDPAEWPEDLRVREFPEVRA